MRLEDLAPALECWDRLNMAINRFVVSSPAMISERAEALGRARVEMARHDLPTQVQRAWSDLHQTIGVALVSAPHEMSASVERLEQRREEMRAAIWDLAKLITPAQQQVIETLAFVMAERHPKTATRRSRR